MNFQPLNIIKSHTPFINFMEGTSLKDGCGSEFLTVFDKDFIPNFYILLDNEPLAGFDLFYSDVNGNLSPSQSINNTQYTKIPTSQGVYYFFNNIPSTFATEGVYQISIGYTDVDTNDYFEIFDYYKFVDNTNDCYYEIKFSNDCNIDNLPFERLTGFEFKFLASEDSDYGRTEPIFEPEFEVNPNGEDVSTYKRMFLKETFRSFNFNQNTLNTFFYASIYDNFEISLPGETRDEVFKLEFSTPVYQGETCCIWYLDIFIIREYKTNSGCCDDVIYSDCNEFDYIEVEQSADDVLEPDIRTNNPNTTNSYLIEDDISNPATAWSTHFNEVATGNGDDTWSYSTPDFVFIKNTGTWKKYNGTSYTETMIFSAAYSGSLGPAAFIDIAGTVEPQYEACFFYSSDGGTTFIPFFTPVSGSDINSGTTIVLDNAPSGQVMIKAEFKLTGCNIIEYGPGLFTTINIP